MNARTFFYQNNVLFIDQFVSHVNQLCFLFSGEPTVVECGMYVNTFDSINIESMVSGQRDFSMNPCESV